MQKSLLNVSYVQMLGSWRLWMHLCAIGRQFTQMNAYFLLINSKRCTLSASYANRFFFLFFLLCAVTIYIYLSMCIHRVRGAKCRHCSTIRGWLSRYDTMLNGSTIQDWVNVNFECLLLQTLEWHTFSVWFALVILP